MEGFWLQIIVTKTQRGNGEAEVHNNSAPLFSQKLKLSVC